MALPPCLGVFLSLFVFFHLSASQAIAAWHNGIAAQVIVQDPVTGDVYYSDCNSTGTPTFPTSPKNVFHFSKKPKIGTPLAGIGYSFEKTIFTGIWYMDTSGAIWQVLAQCQTSQSTFTVTGTYLTSVNITTAVSNSTGLAALLLSKESGYRVFYHNSTGYLYHYGYSIATGWTDSAPLSPDLPAGLSISATVKDYTAIWPFSQDAIGVATYHSDNTFNISSFPYPLMNGSATSDSTQTDTLNKSLAIGNNSLPYWSPANASVGVSTGSSGQTRHIFYIDSNAKLQQYDCDSEEEISCVLLRPQNSSIWPVADRPNSGFGIANNNNVTEIFYYSNQSLISVQLNSSTWRPARLLPTGTRAAVSTTSVSSATNATSSPGISQSSNGLSTGGKAGLAVGVIGGVALIAGIIFIWRSRQIKKSRAMELADTQWSQKGGSKSAVAPMEIEDTQRHEMDGKAKYEMEDNALRQEVDGKIMHEMETDASRHEMDGKMRHEMEAGGSTYKPDVKVRPDVEEAEASRYEMDGEIRHELEADVPIREME